MSSVAIDDADHVLEQGGFQGDLHGVENLIQPNTAREALTSADRKRNTWIA